MRLEHLYVFKFSMDTSMVATEDVVEVRLCFFSLFTGSMCYYNFATNFCSGHFLGYLGCLS